MSFYKKQLLVRQHEHHSAALARKLRVDVYLPPSYRWHFWRRFPLVVFNDGQDLPGMPMVDILRQAHQRGLPECIIVGIYAGDRLQEYGTINRPDYQGRGGRSADHATFVTQELWPWLCQKYRIKKQPKHHSIAGFSLGGLHAFDLAWHYADIFQNVGVFSGALWWRAQPFRADAPDADRIVHTYVEAARTLPQLRFWFQAGTADETEDRNNNGIIDAIDDTLQLMALLREKGYAETEIKYLEIEGGIHHPSTWAEAMPDFLAWALNQ